jgi:hypothetical protein
MKKLILGLIVTLILVFSCGPSYVLTHNFNYTFKSFRQLDSVLTIEKLPKNWNRYTPMIMIGEDVSFEQYVYVRRTDSTEVVYTISDMDSLWRIRKKTVQIYKR